jgi:RNA polymerase sigma factor (sigma-70 family)
VDWDPITMPTADDLIHELGCELDRVRRYARLVHGNADEADDAVADAIARMLPAWRAGRVDAPAAYLRRSVANGAAGRWRRRGLARRKDQAALDWLPRHRDAGEELAERDRTLHALTLLPPRRRAIVALRFYDDLALDEIADTLGISVGTVKSQLSRALDQLRDDLREDTP